MPLKFAANKNTTTTTNNNNDGRMSSTTKTLSRRQLYLPMIAYDNSPDPSGYMASRKSLPNSIQETSLVDFWHKIGVSYHQERATIHDPKNNGHKPLALPELDARIRQKAMTLVGGGINSGWDTTSTASRSNAGGTTTIHEDPRIQTIKRDQKKRKRQIMKSVMNFSTTHDDEEGRRVGQFLYDLNEMWNMYIRRLLQLPTTMDDDDDDDATLDSYESLVRDPAFLFRVTSCITKETVQLVGARVKIQSCQSHPQWRGKTGILVRQTTNTWQLMVSIPKAAYVKKRNTRRRKDNNNRTVDDDNNNNTSTTKKTDGKGTSKEKKASEPSSPITDTMISSKKEGLKTLIVPKQGSSLTLLIPIDVKSPKTTGAGSGNNEVDKQEVDPFILTIHIQEDAKASAN
jgi:hypothetical protein